MYKLQINRITSAVDSVMRLADGAVIPFDPDNTDYQEYLAWIEAGNTPLDASTEVSVPAEENT